MPPVLEVKSKNISNYFAKHPEILNGLQEGNIAVFSKETKRALETILPVSLPKAPNYDYSMVFVLANAHQYAPSTTLKEFSTAC